VDATMGSLLRCLFVCVDCYRGRTAELYAEKERLKDEFRRTRSEDVLASLKDAQERFAKAR
jgi:hypothetical protein